MQQNKKAITFVAHQSDDLEQLFRQCFCACYNTVLVGGADEPEYLPSTEKHLPHKLYYREDFFASAMHETAHWCIAGHERRQQIDFGYWYTSDGRSVDQQRAFEAVEVKPQALECLFSEAAGFQFSSSVDNMAVDNKPSQSFIDALAQQLIRYITNGLPSRAETFLLAIKSRYGLFSCEDDYKRHIQKVIERLQRASCL